MELKEIEKQIQLITRCSSLESGTIMIFIEQHGNKCYNQALDDAFNVAKVGHTPCGDIRECGCNGACERPIAYVDGRSILTLKKH